MKSLKRLLPDKISCEIEKSLLSEGYSEGDITEIRLRINRKLFFYVIAEKGIKVCTIDYRVKKEDINWVLDRVTNYSPYAFLDEIKQGFITIKGGHRIGLAGQTVLESGKIMNIKNISYLNIRLAHQVLNCGMSVIPYITKDGNMLDTLIISPPGCGKTTMLRDIVRIISDGTVKIKPMKVGVVDERSEIAGSYLGEPQLMVGENTDVLDACPKASGMIMLLRSMNPDVIAVDEIGNRDDIEAISYISNCGCGIIATAHGDSIDDVRSRPILRKITDERIFERYIILSRRNGVGTVESIFDERGTNLYHLNMQVALAL